MRFLLTIFLVAGLGSAVSCRGRATKGVDIDSAFTRFIPMDAKVLAGFEVKKLELTPLYSNHRAQFNSGLQAFSQRTGFNPERDVSSVLGAWNGNRFIALARGDFDESKLQAKLDSFGMRRRSYDEYTLFVNDASSILFLRKGTIAAGSARALEQMVDNSKNGQSGVPGELQQQLEVLPANDQLWLVSRSGLPFADVPLRSDIGSALSNIVGYVSRTQMGVAVDSGIHLQADLTCVSDQGAQRVRDALRGGLGLARLSTRDDQLDLLRLYDTVHVDQDRTIIHVRSDLDAELANKLLAYIPELRDRFGEMRDQK